MPRPSIIQALLLAALSPCLATPAAALGVLGKITVKIDGFQGWYQVRDSDLELRFNSIPANTGKGGAFRIEDLGVLGRSLIVGSRTTFSDEAANSVRVLVGRTRISLPVVWRGHTYDDYFIAEPVYCEVLANGTGACSFEAFDAETYPNKLRMMLGVPAVDTPGAQKPVVVAPTPPMTEVSPEQAAPTYLPEPRPAAAPPAPQPPAVVEPVAPPPQKPAAKPDPRFDLDVVEPMD